MSLLKEPPVLLGIRNRRQMQLDPRPLVRLAIDPKTIFRAEAKLNPLVNVNESDPGAMLRRAPPALLILAEQALNNLLRHPEAVVRNRQADLPLCCIACRIRLLR